MHTVEQWSTLAGCVIGGVVVFLIIHFVSHCRRRRKLNAKFKPRPMEIEVPKSKQNSLRRLSSARKSLQLQNSAGNSVAPAEQTFNPALQIPRPSKVSLNPAGKSRSLPRQSIEADANDIEMNELPIDKVSRQNSLARDYSMKPIPRANFQRSQSEMHKGVKSYFQRNNKVTLSSCERHQRERHQYYEESELKDVSEVKTRLLRDRGPQTNPTMRHSYSQS